MRAGTFKFIEGESGLTYDIYPATALDGKRWYRVDVIQKDKHSPDGVRRYDYGFYFKKKVGAVVSIMQREAKLAWAKDPEEKRKPYKDYLDVSTKRFFSNGYLQSTPAACTE